MKNGGERVTFKVSDIMDLTPDYAAGCDLLYTDPPWEQSLVKMFETLAYRDANLPRPANEIDHILDWLFAITPGGIPAFIEYSVGGHERVVQHAHSHGFQCTQVHYCTQTNGKPYVILQFNSDMPPMDYVGGWVPLKKVMEYHKPRRVFELFAGHGQHIRRMIAAGAEVVAAELNPARAAKLQGYFGL